jgi:hypothetical protein
METQDGPVMENAKEPPIHGTKYWNWRKSFTSTAI